jgi:hypothetical protein
VLADSAAGVGGVCVDRGVARGCKGFGGGVGDCEGDEFAAVPMNGQCGPAGRVLLDLLTHQLQA